ncbi:MAG TPA: hypothetical protein VD995_32840 [Azospirillum sp.]|nr:hypothetical protein [Azospirillum sp.]
MRETDNDTARFARPVRVHGAADARAALAAAMDLGVPVALVADAAAGGLWLRTVLEDARAAVPEAVACAVLDCGDRAGDAQAALAAGVDAVLFTGPPAVAARLADIAAQKGAALLTELPEPLDPRGARDAQAACRAWLAGG